MTAFRFKFDDTEIVTDTVDDLLVTLEVEQDEIRHHVHLNPEDARAIASALRHQAAEVVR